MITTANASLSSIGCSNPGRPRPPASARAASVQPAPRRPAALAARIALVALAVAAPACNGGNSLEIRLEFERGARHQCASSDCAEFAFTCRAYVSVLFRDAETMAPARDGESKCVELKRNLEQNMCPLYDVRIPLAGVSRGSKRLEVAIWHPDDLDEGNRCPDDPNLFDLHPEGVPRVTAQPQPAFAGAVYVDVGVDTDVTVPLACTDPGRLIDEECEDTTMTVSARLRDLETGAPVVTTSEIEPSVFYATLKFLPDGQWRIGTIARMVSAPEGSQWQVAADRIVSTPALACILVEVGNAGAEVLSCVEVQTSTAQLSIDAWTLSEERLAALVSATGRETADGLVIGRVLRPTGEGVGGAVVTADPGDVVYLADPGQPAPVGETAPGGWFYSTDSVLDRTDWQVAERGETFIIDYRAGPVMSLVTLLPAVVDSAPPPRQGNQALRRPR